MNRLNRAPGRCYDLRMSPAAWAVVAIAPLYAVALGALALWWDLRRRELALGPQAATAEEVEAFELRKLAEVSARVHETELKLSGVLDTVQTELEDARAERRSAASKLAGASKLTKEREDGGPRGPNGQPPELMSEEDQLAAVEANLPRDPS